jgi:hypothetical protein
MISIEKLKARAKAMVCHKDWWLTMETMIITRQNKLVITVRAFLSDRYFFIKNVFTTLMQPQI